MVKNKEFILLGQVLVSLAVLLCIMISPANANECDSLQYGITYDMSRSDIEAKISAVEGKPYSKKADLTSWTVDEIDQADIAGEKGRWVSKIVRCEFINDRLSELHIIKLYGAMITHLTPSLEKYQLESTMLAAAFYFKEVCKHESKCYTSDGNTKMTEFSIKVTCFNKNNKNFMLSIFCGPYDIYTHNEASQIVWCVSQVYSKGGVKMKYAIQNDSLAKVMSKR